MPEPPVEYTEALNALKGFRTKIFADLVGGRVKASLDAQHESMLKYKDVMEVLGVTPYLMGYIRHMVVALGFKGSHIGGGALRDVRIEYIGDQADYPSSMPYAVPQRKLPQVDYFMFTPVYDLDLLDKTNTATLQSGLLIQCDSGTFKDTPDAENALSDYYMVYPQRRRRGNWSMAGVNTFFGNVNRISGEYIMCARDLIKAGTYEHYTYFMYVWLDAMFCLDGTYDAPFAIAVNLGADVGAPLTHFNIMGQRIESPTGGIWGATKYSDALRGFARVSTSAEELAGFDTVWKNTFKLTIEVSPSAGGHTLPAVGEHTIEATVSQQVQAFAHAGYVFNHWERDGVWCGTNTIYGVDMFKDFNLKAVFVPV